jgi:hypothetical protein
MQLRVARPDDPATRPLLKGLAAEYARMYGEKRVGELSVRQAEDFLPPRGVFLLVLSGRRPSWAAA